MPGIGRRCAFASRFANLGTIFPFARTKPPYAQRIFVRPPKPWEHAQLRGTLPPQLSVRNAGLALPIVHRPSRISVA
jgi:hypothetical protein